MKIGKVKRVIRDVPKPIPAKNWPKPKSIPVEIPQKEKVYIKAHPSDFSHQVIRLF